MAMLLAPLSINPQASSLPASQPSASGGTAPFGGGVAQTVNPWQWIASVMGNTFSFFTVNLGQSSAPEVEAEILQDVGSYGRQLGRISDVIEILVKRLPDESLDELSDEELVCLADFEAQMRAIKKIKHRHQR